MRLKSVFISQYKNLRNFELNFDGTSFIDVFVGKNGSGKSNLFEALIEIFRHLDASRSTMAGCNFNYKLSYEINGDITTVDWRDGRLAVNGNTRKSFDSGKLPDNILIYYSGHNDTVHALVKEYEEKFGRDVKDVSIGQSRLFIGVGTEYKALLLATLASTDGGKCRTPLHMRETRHPVRGRDHPPYARPPSICRFPPHGNHRRQETQGSPDRWIRSPYALLGRIGHCPQLS